MTSRPIVLFLLVCLSTSAALTPLPALGRRAAVCAASSAFVLLPRRGASANQDLPPSAVLLRVAEVTAMQESLLRRAAAMSEQQRLDEGLAVGRPQMSMSVDIFLKNTKLATVRNSEECVSTIRGVALIAEAGEGPLTERELTAMARQYAAARDELRQVFERLPEGEQAVGREVVRKLRTEDQARIRSGQEEAAAASK